VTVHDLDLAENSIMTNQNISRIKQREENADNNPFLGN